VLLAGGCGESSEAPPRSAEPADAPTPTAAKGVLVAALGDSIVAGTPLWDPDPRVRAAIGPTVDERSQLGYWAKRRLPASARFRNCGVNRQRTDEIRARLDTCAKGARVLLVQGGINDIAQQRPVGDAAADLRAMVKAGKQRGARVLLAEVLPWNNGHPTADAPIRELNGLIGQIGRDENVTVLPFYRTLEDPRRPGRMRRELTIEGDHPSLDGYRRLGELVKLPPGSSDR